MSVPDGGGSPEASTGGLATEIGRATLEFMRVIARLIRGEVVKRVIARAKMLYDNAMDDDRESYIQLMPDAHYG